MDRRLRVLIVNGSTVFRQCLSAVLSEGCRHKVSQVDDAAKAHSRLEDRDWDVVLIDLAHADDAELETVVEMRRRYDGIKMIAMGLARDEWTLARLVDAGLDGYVLKESSLEELKQALDGVCKGDSYCPPKVASVLFSRLATLNRRQHAVGAMTAFGLTAREAQVLNLIVEGLSNKEIADRLYLSLHTVKNHVHHILEKLGVENRVMAARKAIERQRRPQRVPGNADDCLPEDDEVRDGAA